MIQGEGRPSVGKVRRVRLSGAEAVVGMVAEEETGAVASVKEEGMETAGR
jgi:hypothetical protein